MQYLLPILFSEQPFKDVKIVLGCASPPPPPPHKKRLQAGYADPCSGRKAPYYDRGPGEVAASKTGASCPAEGEEVFGEQKKRAGHVPGALRPSEAGTV